MYNLWINPLSLCTLRAKRPLKQRKPFRKTFTSQVFHTLIPYIIYTYKVFYDFLYTIQENPIHLNLEFFLTKFVYMLWITYAVKKSLKNNALLPFLNADNEHRGLS